MSKIQLNLNGTAYTGWKKLSVVRSLEAMAGRFDVEATDKQPFPIERGGEVEVLLYDQPVITGYTDVLSVDVDSTENTLTISGRDKTADLVDAAALVRSQEMNNATLREIIEETIKPFGIEAIFDVEPKQLFKKFSFQEETAFEAIERACRLRGVLATSTPAGELIIQSYGTKRAGAGLTLGENVLSARAEYVDRDRFSEYRVYGQQSGDDHTTPEASTKPAGRATDQFVGRYRPLIVIAEGNVDNALAQERAEWEASVRAARASTVEIMVQGWETVEGGELWMPNTLANCYLPPHRIDGDMLIKEVSFTLDDRGGEKTRLVVCRPDAYKKQPDLEAEKAGKDSDG